ncbi:MAG: ABC transporter permease [Mycobacterium sp.]|nr:ABC transporter permease [Mycobacterium sp.]
MSLRTEVPILTARVLRRWSSDPATVAQSLLFPAGLLVALNVVLGNGIKAVTGHSALYGTVPLVSLIGATSGAIIVTVSMMRERDDGLLSRFWVVPTNRASGLVSRLIAEWVRIVAITAFVMCVGMLLGFRFTQGFAQALAWLVMPAFFGVAFSAVVMTIGLYAANTIVPQATEVIAAVLFFFSTGFVPLDQFPKWLQPFVEHQPYSCVIDTMRGLALGGPILKPMLGTLLWSAGIAAVIAVPLAAGYRKASRRD